MEIDANTLQEAVATAMKQWNEPDSNHSPLEMLAVYRRTETNVGPRQATNTLLLNALNVLARSHPIDADLLHRRFVDEETAFAVANQLNVSDATVYRRQNEAIRRLAETIHAQEQAAHTAHQSELEQRFGLPPAIDLIGLAEHDAALFEALIAPGPPWLISIEGMGGLGKTALANALFRRLELPTRFQSLAWVSAKQEEFFDLLHSGASSPPTLPAPLLIDHLLRQLNPNAPLPASPPEREAHLLQSLKETPTLAVIDNLETVADYEALLPLLRRAANPGKFLITSRHSLNLQPDVFCRSLHELTRENVHRFIRREAQQRGHLELAESPDPDLDSIFEVVGGNPLALKLVVGQTTRLPLPHVLDNLRQAQGNTTDKFYTYIYRQAWNLLDEAGRQLLLMMPLASSQGSGLEHLAAVSGLAGATLSQAIEQLAALSLLEISGGLLERRYRIHRLTETFLLTEVAEWQ